MSSESLSEILGMYPLLAPLIVIIGIIAAGLLIWQTRLCYWLLTISILSYQYTGVLNWNGITLNQFLIFLLIIALTKDHFGGHRMLRLSPKYFVIIGGIIAVALGSFFFASSIELWTRDLIELLTGFALVLLTTFYLKERRDLIATLWIFVIMGFLSSLPALVALSSGYFDLSNPRFGGQYGQPNVYSAVALISLFAILIFHSEPYRFFVRIFLWIAFGTISFSIFLTGSRTGLLLLAFLIFSILWVERRWTRKIAIATALLGVSLVLYLLLPSYLQERLLVFPGLTNVTPRDSALVRGSLGNIESRFYFAQVSLSIFLDHPWGVGLGNSILYFSRYGDEALYGQVGVAHNMFVTLLSELGIQGLLMFLALIFALFWDLRRSRSWLSTAPSVVGIFSLRQVTLLEALFLAWLIGGLFQTDSLYLRSYYIILGIIVALPRLLHPAQPAHSEETSGLGKILPSV